MPLMQMFRANVFVGLAIITCMVAILWCIFLMSRLVKGHERFLVGFIGLIAIFQALRILKDAGVWDHSGASWMTDVATFVVCILYLVALFVVHVFGTDYRRTRVRLRLSEANEKPPAAFGQTKLPELESAREHQGQLS